MMKAFVSLDPEELCMEVNTFENRMKKEGFEVFATQTSESKEVLGKFTAFVYYRKDVKAMPRGAVEERVGDLVEIGAAWPDRKYPEKLSIKLSETNEWTSCKLSEIKDTGEGKQYKDYVLVETEEEWRSQDKKRPLYKVFQRK